MKRLVFIITIFFTFISVAENTEGFNSYVKKNYKKAKEHFQKDFNSSGMDPLYSYNLGVTSQTLGQKGDAVFYYLQTLQRAPELSEAKNNLNLLVKDLSLIHI